MSDNHKSTTTSSSRASRPPSEAMMILLAPDGYYTYLQIPKSTTISSSVVGSDRHYNNGSSPATIDDLIKKNYRKLSIRHHPDKPGGDVETFRLLKRAQMVLTSPKLKQQYDVLGIDLDDDDDDDDDQVGDEAMTKGDSSDSTSTNDKSSTNGPEPRTTSQGIVHEIASMALTAVLQLCVRTALLAFVSVFVTRYRLLLFPALTVLLYVAYQIRTSTLYVTRDLLSPITIGLGLIIMYQSSVGSWSTNTKTLEQSAGMMNVTTTTFTNRPNFWWYWVGETMVIVMFTFNSLSITQQRTSTIVCITIGFGIVAALWFRGKFWNYFIVLVLEIFLALFIAVSFPFFEMILEVILNDKLKKIGDKVRAQHQVMEQYYRHAYDVSSTTTSNNISRPKEKK